MKQTSLLGVLFARAQSASQAPDSAVREAGGDAFSRALQSARGDRQASTANTASRASAEPRVGTRETLSDRSGGKEADAVPAPSPLAPRAAQPETPPATNLRKQASALESETAGDKPAPVDQVAKVVESLDTPVREQFTRQLLTLQEALQSGELDPQEALKKLETLLEDNGLSLDQGMQQLLQALSEMPLADSDKPSAPLLALVDLLRQGLAEIKQKSMAEQGGHAAPVIAGGQRTVLVASNAPPSRAAVNIDLTTPLERVVTSQQAAEVSGRSAGEKGAEQNTATVLSSAISRSPGEDKPAVVPRESSITLKDSSVASSEPSVTLKETEAALKKLMLGDGEARPRVLGDSTLLSQTLSSEKGSAVALGLQPLAGSTSAAAPIPTERGFTVQTMVNTLVGQPNWGQAVGQRVMWLAQQNIAEAQLRLDPPDLGPVKVKISVQNDQAQVVFTSHSPAVREALDQNAQRLRELFAEQGLDLINVDVSDDRQQGHERGESADESGALTGSRDGTDTDNSEAPQWVMEGQLTLVDHYA